MLEIGSPPDLRFAEARTSQSPFPLYDILLKTMPRILITGNGFDLHHKLPTTYKDFIKIIDYLINNQDYSFSKIYENSHNFETLKENFNEDIHFAEENLKSIIEIANKNLLFNFFRDELQIDTWIDFENKIEYLLKNVFFTIRVLRETIVSTGPINPNRSYSIKTYLKNNIVFAKILHFLGIIQMNSQEFWIDRKFLVEKYSYFVEIDEEKIINLIYSQLIEFRKLFNLYLQTFVIPLYDKYSNKNHLIDIFDKIDFYFTFNYTPTFERIYNQNNISVNYLHGKSEDQTENIVFGISELFDKECENSEYIKFTKYFQKFNNRTDFYFLNKIEKSDSENYVFYFWGHSLDKSDSNYVNEIFDFLDTSKSSIKRIVIIYHSEGSRSHCLLNLFSIRGKKDIEAKMKSQELVFYKIDSNELKQDLTQSIMNPPTAFFF